MGLEGILERTIGVIDTVDDVLALGVRPQGADIGALRVDSHDNDTAASKSSSAAALSDDYGGVGP